MFIRFKENATTATVFIWPIITILFLVVCKLLVINYNTIVYDDLFALLLLISLETMFSIKRKNPKAQYLQNVLAVVFIAYLWMDTCMTIALYSEYNPITFLSDYSLLEVLPFFATPKIISMTIVCLLFMVLLRKKKDQFCAILHRFQFAGL